MSPRAETLIFAVTLAVGVLVSASLMLRDTGAASDDEIGHYLICRDALSRPELLLSTWGRTVNSLFFLPAAQLGWAGTRAFALAATALATWLTYRVGVRLGLRFAYLTPVALWGQPWVLLQAHTCQTEVPFLLFLVAATLLALRGEFWAASFVIGCLPHVRHEGVALTGACGLVALATRSWGCAALLTLPSLLVNVVAYAAEGTLPFLVYFHAKPTTLYGSGGWLYYLSPVVESSGPVALLAIVGVPYALRNDRRLLALALPALYFAVHVVIYKFGLFASGGYSDFLSPLAPFLALLALLGVEALSDATRPASVPGRTDVAARKFPGARGVVLALLVLGTVGLYGVRSARPYRLHRTAAALVEAAVWLRESHLTATDIVATHVVFHYHYPLPIPHGDVETLWTASRLQDLPVGAIVVWDERYSDLWNVKFRELAAADSGWERLKDFGADHEVTIFRKRR